MTDTEFYSPAEAARVLGVSATTIKRWVDAGVLPAHKTVGGHRRILAPDVLRMVRDGNFPFVDLSSLNLSSGRDDADPKKLSLRLFDALHAGDITMTRSVIHGAYASGMAIAELGDGVVAPAMSHLGHDWETGRIDVMHEHRGTQLCTAVLHELKPVLEANARKGRPVAAGGNPEGDQSILASLLIQMVLLDAGWDAINLGPHTPLASFRVALRELDPRVMWMSASYVVDPPQFLMEYRKFSAEAREAGVIVAIGGQAIDGSLRAKMPYDFHGDNLAQLAGFARTLHPRPSPPKRGRPFKRETE